jgi:hypothetical protein
MQRSINRYTILFMGLVVLMTGIVVKNMATNQRIAAEPLRYEDTIASYDQWLKFAREMAESEGLVGEPSREEMVLMSLVHI